jgi:hypothetical protein
MDQLTTQTPKSLLAFLENDLQENFPALICLPADEFCKLRLSISQGIPETST